MATYTPSSTHSSNGTWAATNSPISDYLNSPTISSITGPDKHGTHLGIMGQLRVSEIIENILYTDGFWDSITSNKYNPLAAIMSCFKLPFNPDNPSGSLYSVSSNILWLNGHDYELSANIKYALTQWYTYRISDIDIPAYFDGFMDYAPYTKIQLYLPFIGFIDINPALCIGGKIGIQYRFDMTNGNCMAEIRCTDKNGTKQIITSPTGNAAFNIPLTGANDMSFANGVLNGVQVGIQTISTIAGVPILGAVANKGLDYAFNIEHGILASDDELTPAQKGQAMAGLMSGRMAAGAQIEINQKSKMISGITGSLSGIANTVSSALNTPTVSGSTGSVSGNMGIMTRQYPFVLITRPNYCIPENYAKQYGYPSNITDTIANFEGYLEVGSVHLDSIVATASEKAEIDALLKSGVIVPRTSST